MNKYSKNSLLLAATFFTILGLLRFFHVYDYLTLEQFQYYSLFCKAIVEKHYFLSRILFVSIYTGMIACGLPITILMGLLAGFLFSFWQGWVLTLVGAVAGTAILFLIVRYGLYNLLHEKYGKQLESFHASMEKYGCTYLLSMNLFVVFPYFVTSTLAALAGVPLITSMWTTAIGSAPILGVYVFAGRQLATLRSLRDIVSPQMLVLLVGLGCMALVPLLVRLYKERFGRS